MRVGYTRISTKDQSPDLQIDALRKAGCEKIFSDCVSGSRADRPGLDDALHFLREGDTLVVWQLDRLGRSVKNMLELANMFSTRGIELVSLRENIDTTTAVGRMFFTVLLALSEFERSLMIERTHAGLAAAKARGRNGGRPGLSQGIIEAIVALRKQDKSFGEIGAALGINASTAYRNWKKAVESKPS